MKILKRVAATIVLLVSIVLFAACDNKPKNNVTGNVTVTASTRNSLTLKIDLADPDDVVTKSSLKIKLYEIVDGKESETEASTTTLSTLLTKNANGEVINTETKTIKSLKEACDYQLKFTCVIDDYTKEVVNTKVSTSTAGSDSSTAIEISSIADLEKIKDDYSANYKLTADLDYLKDNAKTEVDPLFTSSSLFTGSFDGNGHTIKNFKQTKSTSYQGFFGYLGENAKITNLNFDSIDFDISRYGDLFIGVVAGAAESNTEVSNITITNLSLKAKCQQDKKVLYAGGLIGDNKGAKISNVHISGSMELTSREMAYVGGVTGIHEAVGTKAIDGAYVDMSIKLTQKTSLSSYEKKDDVFQSVGGIVGYLNRNCTITNVSAKGSIDSSFEWALKTEGSFKVFKEAGVKKNIQIGGLVGQNSGKISNSLSMMDIAFSSISAFNVKVGLIAGWQTLDNEISNVACLNKSLTLKLTPKENDKTVEDKDKISYERNVYVGVVALVEKDSHPTNTYVKALETFNNSTLVTAEVTFAGTTSNLDDITLTEEVKKALE